MKAKFAMMVLAAVAAVAPVWAQWREDGKPVPDTEWRKAWGKHGAMLHLTDRPDELFAAWEKPGHTVPVAVTEVVKRGEAIVAVVFFSGCSVDDRGHCNAEVEFRALKPDGTPYGEERGELWIGKPPPPKGQLQLSVGALGLRIEPQDPEGTYTIHVHVRDNVSRASVELSRSFRVEASPRTE